MHPPTNRNSKILGIQYIENNCLPYTLCRKGAVMDGHRHLPICFKQAHFSQCFTNEKCESKAVGFAAKNSFQALLVTSTVLTHLKANKLLNKIKR